jgi:hypothetical protein
MHLKKFDLLADENIWFAFEYTKYIPLNSLSYQCNIDPAIDIRVNTKAKRAPTLIRTKESEQHKENKRRQHACWIYFMAWKCWMHSNEIWTKFDLFHRYALGMSLSSMSLYGDYSSYDLTSCLHRYGRVYSEYMCTNCNHLFLCTSIHISIFYPHKSLGQVKIVVEHKFLPRLFSLIHSVCDPYFLCAFISLRSYCRPAHWSVTESDGIHSIWMGSNF